MDSDAEDDEEQNRWFYAELNQVHLLVKCLRPLTDLENLAENLDNFCISENGIFLASTTNAYLHLPVQNFTAFHCQQNRVLRLHFRHLEGWISDAVKDYGNEDGLTLCITGDMPNYTSLQLCMRNSGGPVLCRFDIRISSSYLGLMGMDLLNVVNYRVSIGVEHQTFMLLIEFASLFGFEVQVNVKKDESTFRVVSKEIVLREEIGRYWIDHEEGEIVQYPFFLKFDLYQKSALVNAAILLPVSEPVWLHQLMDFRTVVMVNVRGLGTIQFCFQP